MVEAAGKAVIQLCMNSESHEKNLVRMGNSHEYRVARLANAADWLRHHSESVEMLEGPVGICVRL